MAGCGRLGHPVRIARTGGARFIPGIVRFLILVVVATTASVAPCQPPTAAPRPAAKPPADTAQERPIRRDAGAATADADKADDDGDLARKAEIMNSPRWRRAIFELGEWLSAQPIYSPEQVRQIKADFNRRVGGMSSFELEYLLDDLDAKFKILDTPEARDARDWLGQYLSVMSDRKRAEALRDVPDVVKMSAGQLQREVAVIEQRRASLQQRQAGFEQRRDRLVDVADAARQQTAAASAAAAARLGSGGSFSPYRSGPVNAAPFADAKVGSEQEFFGFGFGFW